MHFDYTPLAQPVPYKELFGYIKELPKNTKIVLLVMAGVDALFVILALIALPGVFTAIESASVDGFQTNFVLVLIGAMALGMPFAYLQSQQEAIRIKRFALLNNLTYYCGPLVGDNTGLIFLDGHTKSFDFVFEPQKNTIKEFGSYTYVTGSGKNSQTHTYGYVRVKLPRKLPNMVLDSRENNIFGQSGLPKTLRKDQVLELEGDFNKYFTLYAPKEYERDALYIFTPDVMQAMVDAPDHYDGEIVDDDFYLYTSKLDIHDTDAIEELLSIADRIALQLDEQADNYSDERVGGSERNIIAAPGIRLRSSVMTRATVVIALVTVAYCIIWIIYR